MFRLNEGTMGLVIDLSGVDQGNKPINGPKDVVVDGNSNIVVLSKNEKMIHKYKLKLENKGKGERFRFKSMNS